MGSERDRERERIERWTRCRRFQETEGREKKEGDGKFERSRMRRKKESDHTMQTVLFNFFCCFSIFYYLIKQANVLYEKIIIYLILILI